MARRRKHRTHVVARDHVQDGVPKSFIIKHGHVGPSLTQLVRDFRKVMEPNTASRLRERLKSKLKDYLTMAPALQVTHLLAFTLTDVAPSMRLVRLSNGPTLSFRIERYSLMKDVLSTSKRSRSMGLEYLSPPLLVLASFPQSSSDTPPHLKLLVKSFQSLFPPLSPYLLKLSNARRVVLVSYNADSNTVDVRHYIITVKPYGVSRRMRRVLEGVSSKPTASSSGVLDLGNEKDVADFLLRKRGEPGPDGYESASSVGSVAGDEENAVDLADDYVGRNNQKGQRKAVRLDEVGPRLELRLIKIVEGVPGKEGAVIYHNFVKKSKTEITSQKAEHAAKDKLRKQRREEQERNVARKKAAVEDNAQEADDDEGEWDENEEISEEGGDSDGEGDEEGDSEEQGGAEEDFHPNKKARLRERR